MVSPKHAALPTFMTQRVSPAKRLHQLSEAAWHLALSRGIEHVSRRNIAFMCNVSLPLITHYLGSGAALRALVFKRAVEERNDEIFADALEQELLDDFILPRDVLARASDLVVQRVRRRHGVDLAPSGEPDA